MLKKLLPLLSVLLLTSCNYHRDNKYTHFEESITYQQKTLPCVSFKVKQSKATFILDTGSEMNIIDESYYNKHKSSFNVIDSAYTRINTIEGEAFNMVKICETQLNDSIDVKFYVVDISSTAKHVFTNDGILIHGILGIDFLYKHKVIINFDARTIYNIQKDSLQCNSFS